MAANDRVEKAAEALHDLQRQLDIDQGVAVRTLEGKGGAEGEDLHVAYEQLSDEAKQPYRNEAEKFAVMAEAIGLVHATA